MCRMFYGSKKQQKYTYNSGFLTFSDYHSTPNLLIHLFLDYFLQQDSPAYFYLFVRTMAALCGPLWAEKG